jgi:hypothetical protein
MADDPEPDETRVLRAQEHMGTVQRWDTPEGMTFRLDLWPVDSDERDDETETDPDADDHAGHLQLPD